MLDLLRRLWVLTLQILWRELLRQHHRMLQKQLRKRNRMLFLHPEKFQNPQMLAKLQKLLILPLLSQFPHQLQSRKQESEPQHL